MDSNESCKNCAYFYKLDKSDYSKNGCTHQMLEGYICMAFADEGIASWMYGVSEDGSICECYSPKKNEKRIKNASGME